MNMYVWVDIILNVLTMSCIIWGYIHIYIYRMECDLKVELIGTLTKCLDFAQGHAGFRNKWSEVFDACLTSNQRNIVR